MKKEYSFPNMIGYLNVFASKNNVRKPFYALENNIII